MKAIRVHAFGGPEQLVLEDVAAPKPGPDEVLVRVHAAGVNPAETYTRSGTYAKKPPLPWTPGTDAAGVIEQVGSGVRHLAEGQSVYVAGTPARRMSGTYAELVACEAACVFPLADTVTFAQGAAVGVPCTTAYRALFQIAHLAPDEWVLVHGASGGVGLAAVQLARAAGARVIGTAGTEEGRHLVAAQGASAVLDHRREGYLTEVAPLTGGTGPAVIVEMLADRNLEADLQVIAPRGRLVIVGSRGTLDFAPRSIMAKDAVVCGMLLWNIGTGDFARAHAALGAALSLGTLRPVIRAELPLGEAARAHRDVMTPGALGKIVLVP